MRTVALVLIISLVGACTTQASSVVDRRVAEFLGEEVVNTIRTPDRVASIRIDGGLDERGKPGEKVADFPIIANGPDLTADQVRELQSLIFDATNYEFDSAKGCEFMPGVVFRFEKGSDLVDVLLCFSCDEWAFLRNGNWKIEDNDRARSRLLALAKAAFPDDAVLAKLR